MEESHQKRSLEKLTSPDQIDRRLIIIRMPSWVALLCLFVLIISIVLWSIFGRIPMTANGMGIFFEPKAISLIPSQVEGFVSTIGVGQGDEVKQGEVLMVLRSPQMERAGKELQEKISFLEKEIVEIQRIELQKNGIELEHSQAIYALQQKRLQEITSDPDQKQALYELQIAMENEEAHLRLIEEKIAHPKRITSELTLENLKEKESLLKEEMRSLTIQAVEDGTVMLVDVLPGEEVTLGNNLIWFQKKIDREEPHFVYSFFPLKSGNPIKPGMQVHMQFQSVNPTLYGKMEGVVTRVIPFTATAKGILLKSIPSETLKEYLTQEQATLVIEIAPVRAKTLSGYRWTTPQGPPFSIAFGEVAHVEVFIEKRAPITYIIPIRVSK